MAQFYRHSGIVPLPGLIQTSLAGLGSALSLGVVYGYASAWMPFIYLNFIMTAGFGFVVAWLINRAARAGRIRNTLVPKRYRPGERFDGPVFRLGWRHVRPCRPAAE